MRLSSPLGEIPAPSHPESTPHELEPGAVVKRGVLSVRQVHQIRAHLAQQPHHHCDLAEIGRLHTAVRKPSKVQPRHRNPQRSGSGDGFGLAHPPQLLSGVMGTAPLPRGQEQHMHHTTSVVVHQNRAPAAEYLIVRMRGDHQNYRWSRHRHSSPNQDQQVA